MSAKWTLDIAAMQEDFFADSALIGIVSALPAYRFCWSVNKYADVNFLREPDLDIAIQGGSNQEDFFAIYQYSLPLSGSRHLLYKLKNEKEILLPEVKQLDYLWLVQSSTADAEAQSITQTLRDIPNVQLAQILAMDKIRSLNNLLV